MKTRYLPVWLFALALIGAGLWQGNHDAARAAGTLTITSPGTQSLLVGVPMNPINMAALANDSNPGAILKYSATGLPAPVSIDLNTGVISGTPPTVGAYSVFVKVDDLLNGLSATTPAIAMNVVLAPPPTIVTPGTITIPVNVAYSSNVSALANSPNGYPLTFTAAGLPTGVTMSTAGVISGTPTTSGTSSVTIKVTDGHSGSASTNPFSFVVSPVVAPTIVTPAAQSYTANTPIPTLQIVANSPSGSLPLTYTQTGLPAGLTISSTTGAITGTPTSAAGTIAGRSYPVTVTVKDANNNATTTGLFTVTVFVGDPTIAVDNATVNTSAKAGSSHISNIHI